MQGDNKSFQVCKRKMVSCAEQLCKYNPSPFRRFTEFVLSMRFDEEPKYDTCIALFQPLLDGPAERPIRIDPTSIKVCLRHIPASSLLQAEPCAVLGGVSGMREGG